MTASESTPARLGGVDRPPGLAVLLAACVSAFVVNANTSAVTILLPTMSEDTGSSVAQYLPMRYSRTSNSAMCIGL